MTGPLELARAAGALWAAPGRVRLRTLIVLRWIAIAGQTAAVLLVQFGLKFDLPLAAALSVIAASAWVNLILMIIFPSQRLLREWEAAAQLAYDLLQLTVLVGLTGGVENPFMLLLIAPLAVSAVLRSQVTAVLAALAFACVGALALWSAPLPWIAGQPFAPPPLYRAGLAAAVLIGLAFTSVCAWRVAMEEERLNAALETVQNVLAREQRLSALGALAAAAAHELGTPLATIHLVAKEMAREAKAGTPLADDVHLLISQSERCRDILRQLSSRGDQGDVMHERLPLAALLDEVVAPHRGLGPEIAVTMAPMEGAEALPPPELRRLPEVLYGLNNLIENAVGFAESQVEVLGRWSATELELAVRDDGAGFPPAMLNRLGEPYVSGRGPDSPGGGLGLGFFIAKTLLERTGARVEHRNRTPPRTGAVVRAIWDRPAIVEASALAGEIGHKTAQTASEPGLSLRTARL
ncbi:MAG: ActS/PrrB/RegB family redox-sensitive histidine kinase [Hyphomonadaceae bacterium]